MLKETRTLFSLERPLEPIELPKEARQEIIPQLARLLLRLLAAEEEDAKPSTPEEKEEHDDLRS
jgi:hypothetical protein